MSTHRYNTRLQAKKIANSKKDEKIPVASYSYYTRLQAKMKEEHDKNITLDALLTMQNSVYSAKNLLDKYKKMNTLFTFLKTAKKYMEKHERYRIIVGQTITRFLDHEIPMTIENIMKQERVDVESEKALYELQITLEELQELFNQWW